MRRTDEFTRSMERMKRNAPSLRGSKLTQNGRQPRVSAFPPQTKKKPSLTIGLVNNMPDAAFRATERQFLSLLEAAASDVSVRVVLYTLPEIEREGACRRYAQSHYKSVETLWGAPLDGLIVTGREPKMQSLKDESYWGSLTSVLEWARENTYSTVWSCLAAHAAILHMDNIERRKSNRKHFGVLECERIAEHTLTAGLPQRFDVPHSRWNGIEEKALERCGYAVLSRCASAGVDMFVKQVGSLFVFLQGHPEYSSDTLLREYRREVTRHLQGDSECFPSIPGRYFDVETAAGLNAIEENAKAGMGSALESQVASLLKIRSLENHWHRTATSVYRNWLKYILASKNAAEAGIKGHDRLICKDGPLYRENAIWSEEVCSSSESHSSENQLCITV